MKVIIVAAMDKNNGIGKNNKIPWRLSDDLKKFKSLTINKCIVMGRKTLESLKKPLPKRDTIVMTKNSTYKTTNERVYIAEDICSINKILLNLCAEEVFICGGSEIYKLFMDKANEMYLTHIDAEVECDTFFPEFNKEQWQKCDYQTYTANSKNEYDFIYQKYVRI